MWLLNLWIKLFFTYNTSHKLLIYLKDVEGKTPLHSAIEAGNQSVVEKLIQQNGIDLCTRDKSGLSPFACAMTYKNQKAAQKILQVGCKSFSFKYVRKASISFMIKNKQYYVILMQPVESIVSLNRRLQIN